MQNGNSGNKYNYSGRNYNGGDYVNIAGFRIKPLFFYIGIGAILLIVMAFLINLVNTSIAMHFGLVAGALLLLANLRELLGYTYGQHNSTALLNCLIGGGLVCAWLSQTVSVLFWVPAVALVAVAFPLVLGRTSVYTTYVQAARTAVSGVRRAVGR
jgi:hypothetical protein